MVTLEKPLAKVHASSLEELYETCFPAVAAFVSKMHGSLQDAKDIFHDALVVFHEKNLDKDFKISISNEAYLVGIAKHLWIRRFKNTRRHVSLNNIESTIRIAEDFFPSVNESRLILFLESTGKKCMDLLRDYSGESEPPFWRKVSHPDLRV